MADENGGRADGGSETTVTEIRIDARLMYGAIAVVALIAVGAIGLFAGRLALTESAPEPVAASIATEVPGAGELAAGLTRSGTPGGAMPELNLNVPTTVDGQPMIKPAVRGRSPVRPDQVPIGPSEPRLWFSDLADQDWELRLGDLDPTGPVERDVVIENVGTSPLVLANAGGECGCTAVVLEAQELAPAGRTVLRIKYDPRVSNDAGKQIRKQIYVISNDPLAPAAEFHITANVLAQ